MNRELKQRIIETVIASLAEAATPRKGNRMAILNEMRIPGMVDHLIATTPLEFIEQELKRRRGRPKKTNQEE